MGSAHTALSLPRVEGMGRADCEWGPCKEKPHLEVAKGWLVGLELVLSHCDLSVPCAGVS